MKNRNDDVADDDDDLVILGANPDTGIDMGPEADAAGPSSLTRFPHWRQTYEGEYQSPQPHVAALDGVPPPRTHKSLCA